MLAKSMDKRWGYFLKSSFNIYKTYYKLLSNSRKREEISLSTYLLKILVCLSTNKSSLPSFCTILEFSSYKHLLFSYILEMYGIAVQGNATVIVNPVSNIVSNWLLVAVVNQIS